MTAARQAFDVALTDLDDDRSSGCSRLAEPVVDAFDRLMHSLADETPARRWPALLEALARLCATRPVFAAPGVAARRRLADWVIALGGDPFDPAGASGWPRPAPGAWRLAHSEVARRGREKAAMQQARLLAAGRELLQDCRRVLTISRSSQVERLLREALPADATVLALESLPGGEGRALVAELRNSGRSAAWLPDAQAASVLESCDLVLCGVDAIRPGRSVTGATAPLSETGWRGFAPPDLWAVNKCGSRALAVVARRTGVPCWIVAGPDKVGAHSAAGVPDDGEERVVAGDALELPLFEAFPLALATGVLGGAGLLSRAELVEQVLRDARLCQVLLN